MSKVFHPFIVDFIASFQDEKFIYIVVHLIQGGELFSRVHDAENEVDGLLEHQAKFYALCIADALAYLHRQNYVFRGRSIIHRMSGFRIILFDLPILSFFFFFQISNWKML